MQDAPTQNPQKIDVADPVPGFPKVSVARMEADLNAEFLTLAPGYYANKARRISWWKEYRFQKYGNEKQGQSQVVDSTIFNAVEWMLPSLVQPFMETASLAKLVPADATLEKIVAAECFSTLLDTQIRRRQRWYLHLHDTWKGALVQGESYGKVVWNHEAKKPEVRYIPAAQLRYDWTVQDFYDSKVVTQEEDMTKSDIKKLMDGAPGVIEDRYTTMIQGNGRGIPTGYLANEKKEVPNWVGEKLVATQPATGLFLRREHWTEYDMDGSGLAIPIMAVFIEDRLVQVIKNPYSFQHHPFLINQSCRDPLGLPAIGMAEVLSDIQKYRTAILRLTSDNLNSQGNGLYECDMTNMDEIGTRLLQFAPQGTRVPIPVRKPGSINALAPAPIAGHAFTTWELLEVAGENRSGYTRYSQGLDSKSLNQTATGITNIMQRSDMRVWEVAQRFAENYLQPMVRMLIALNQQMITREAVQMQFGMSGLEAAGIPDIRPGEWIYLDRSDIGGYFHIIIDVNVASDKQTQIQNMFQYANAFAPFINQGVPAEVISVIAVETAKLMGLPKIQAVMKETYVGSGGVTIPRSLFNAQSAPTLPGGSGGMPQGTPEGAGLGGMPGPAGAEYGFPTGGGEGLPGGFGSIAGGNLQPA